MVFLTYILLGVFLFHSPLYAGAKDISEAISPVVSVDDSGFYMGLGTGWIQLKDDFTEEYFETQPLLLQAGYRLDTYFAIEGRYLRDVGKVSYENGTTSNPDNNDFPTTFRNKALYLKPMYPAGDYTLYALLGYGEVSLSDIRGADRTEKGLQWGVGISYTLSAHITLFVDYTSLYEGHGFDGRAKVRNTHVDLVIAGASYVF